MDPVERTVRLADRNVERGGKPFSCVVFDPRSGEVVAESPNLVVQTGDPTAHAEVVAVRQACARLGAASLEGYEVYVLAHPCPMCLGALYYAGPDRVVFVVTREEEARFYKDDGRYFELETFYEEFGKPWPERRLPLERDRRPEGLAVYERWQKENG